MGFIDLIREAEELVTTMRDQIIGPVKRNEFAILATEILDLLVEALTTFNSVIAGGAPYPPDKLEATDVTASQVDLEWEKATLNLDHHYVERSPNGVDSWSDISGDLPDTAESYSDITVNPSTDYWYRVKAYIKFAKPDAKKLVWRNSDYTATAFPEDITSSLEGAFAFVVPKSGEITNIGLYIDNTGEDATNPLEIEADVKINGITVLTTKPKITKDAADGSNSYVAGTGITQAVLDTSALEFEVGDKITVDLNLTRTASPTDEMAGVVVMIDCHEGERADSDPSNVITVTTPAS
jgi:hypothetical protein